MLINKGEIMKKLLLFLITLIFLTVSCGGSKKTENDADSGILPDEDAAEEEVYGNDEDYEDSEEEETEEDADEADVTVKNPCYPNPCRKIADSTGKCEPDGDDSYVCLCNEKYFWNGKNCINPCFYGVSCRNFEHSTGECRGEDASYYTCVCEENYYWWGTGKGCTETKPGPANICTGADLCYSTWEVLKCRKPGEEFYGQDADYAALGFCAPQSFSMNKSVKNEPTRIDNNLKIEWMNNVADSMLSWEEAAEYCGNLEYGGYSDWRLPLPKELMLAAPLPNTKEEIYLWSSMPVPGLDSSAWLIKYGDRTSSAGQKAMQYNVRCVRGEPVDASASFKSIDTNLVMDYKNGFMWSTANYTRGKMWNEAITECEKSTSGGFSDWRLPNINELATLMNFEKSDPSADFPYPENIPVYFWSSTTQKSDIEYSPGVSIYSSGEIKNLEKTGGSDSQNHVVCVRNEPCSENYFWDGVKCAESPCFGNPCGNAEHSDGICHLSDAGGYFCGCVENYFWDGVKCANPCDADPCAGFEHTTDTCKPRDDRRYTCGCEENYYWWGQSRGCIESKPGMAHLCTGQTKCYDNEKEIECPSEGEKFYGQDAQYADLGYCAPKLYTVEKKVENEPVVIDEYTGLIWQQKVYVPEKSIGWSKYKNYCENSNYGGYDDWRLPSVYELKTIMDFGKYHPNVDPEYFPDTPPEYFVTSTYTSNSCGDLPYITPSTWVRLINFDHFETDTYTGCSDNPPFKLPARCVREKANPASTWSKKISDMETVYVDSTNGVMLTALDFYAPDRKWEDAFDICENMTYAGFSDWRLPNIWQLILYGGEMSSTTEAYDPTKAVSQIWKEIRYEDVRCIRDNPCEKGKFWFNENCIENPCLSNPCNSTPGSVKTCRIIDEENYSCTCKKGTWDDELKDCVVE